MYSIRLDNHVLYKVFSEPCASFCFYFRNRNNWMGDNVIWWGLLWRIRKHRNEDLTPVPHPSVFPPFFKHSSILNKHGRISAEKYCGKQISSFFKPLLANISLVAQACFYEHTLCLYFHCVVNPVLEDALCLKSGLHFCAGWPLPVSSVKAVGQEQGPQLGLSIAWHRVWRRVWHRVGVIMGLLRSWLFYN